MTLVLPEHLGPRSLTALGVATCAVLGLAAALSPSTTLYVVAACALVAIALRSLIALLAVFTVLTFPEQLPFGIASGTVAKPLGALLVVSWILHLLRVGESPVRRGSLSPETSLLAGFVAFALVSVLWASGASAVLSDFSRLVPMALLFVIVVSAVRSRRELMILAGTYVFASFATASYALSSGTSIAGRLTGGIANSNFLAAELGSAILLAGFLLPAARHPLARAGLVLTVVVDTFAFVLTQSRGGSIALGVGLVLAVAFAGRWRAQAVVATLTAGAIGAMYVFAVAAPSVRDRLTNISAQGSSGRSDEWQIALRIFEGHPLGGAGLGNYAVLAPHYASDTLQLFRVQFVLKGFVAHNTYLQILSELGLIGLVLFGGFVLVVLAAALRTIASRRLASDPSSSALARGIFVALVSLLVAYFFGSALFQKQLWLLLGLAAALPVLTARGAERGPDG